MKRRYVSVSYGMLRVRVGPWSFRVWLGLGWLNKPKPWYFRGRYSNGAWTRHLGPFEVWYL